jgi:hypothetical protein
MLFIRANCVGKNFQKIYAQSGATICRKANVGFFWGEKIGFNKIMRFGCAFYPAKILGFFVLRYEVCIRRIFYSCETLVREKCVIFSNALF